ncbi:unnamed protein product, partial [Iphiclides podalirius]
MVIEKLHGLQATALTLNERFTILSKVVPERNIRARTPQRRANFGSLNLNNNRNIIEQIARKLQQQVKRQAVKQRLGMMRRYGSESSLPGLRRSNSFGNLNERQSIKNRMHWQQSNNNLSRSASFGNLSQGGLRGRGFRRRGGRPFGLRGKLRTNATFAPGGRWQFRRTFGRNFGKTVGRTQTLRRQTRGRGRGGILRNRATKAVPTREELDAQLDQYMASTKSALDKELDAYMKSAMELE